MDLRKHHKRELYLKKLDPEVEIAAIVQESFDDKFHHSTVDCAMCGKSIGAFEDYCLVTLRRGRIRGYKGFFMCTDLKACEFRASVRT